MGRRGDRAGRRPAARPRARDRRPARRSSSAPASATRVWLTADVHYTAAHYYDPEQGGVPGFRAVLGVRLGPAPCRHFGPGHARQHVRAAAPLREGADAGSRAQNLPPSDGLQFFGHVAIDGATRGDDGDAEGRRRSRAVVDASSSRSWGSGSASCCGRRMGIARAKARATPILPATRSCAAAPGRRDPWRGFRRVIAHLGRVVRRVLLAAQRLARELDQVMRDEAHAEHGVDLAAAHRVTRRAPERLAVVRQDSDVQHDPERQHQRAPTGWPS